MVNVVIAGAGMAGMSAALRLSQRPGYNVTLLEQNETVGGKYGTVKKDRNSPLRHEHCFHMLLNWFNNFWNIADELGLRDKFIASPNIKYIRRGEWPHITQISDVGAAQTALKNLFSGVVSIPDMFIYSYSLIDLLSTPVSRGEFRDFFSVNGFMHSRPYMSDPAAELNDYTLAKAFACPSFLTSAVSYQKFIAFGLRHPSPMMWVLKGNVYDNFLVHLERRLRANGCDLRLLNRVERIELDNSGTIGSIEVSVLQEEPRPANPQPAIEKRYAIKDIDYLILAVPHTVLGRFVDDKIFDAAPELANVRKLRSEPMASLDLYFKKKLEHIPADHVILIDAKYSLAFIDNSQIWPDEKNTFLNVSASDFDPLAGLALRDAPPGIDSAKGLSHVKDFIMDKMLAELNRFLPFEREAIDYEKTYLQLNTGETLFVNETGSWPDRPDTVTAIPNLFIAGDFCKNPIDVVTVEGATVSGLLAAEEVRKRAGYGAPVEIILPDQYPDVSMAVLKALGAPYAYGAKLWATAYRELEKFSRL